MKVTNHFGKTHKTYAMIGGGSGLGIAVFVAITVGSPFPILRMLGAEGLLPPIWLMGLLWFASYALEGCAAGIAAGCLGGRGDVRETGLWRGMTFLVAEITFSLAWYRLLFCSFLLFPSFCCLLLAVCAGIVCLLSWFPIHKLSAALCAGVTMWRLCLMFTQVIVILHN